MQRNDAAILPDSLASIYHDTHKARARASWWSIARELKLIRELAERLHGELTENGSGDPMLLESLTWHLVLRYGRCFDSGAAGRTTALGQQNVLALGNAAFTQIHLGLIHRRHNTFAHPGGDCSCRVSVHLVENKAGPLLIPTPDEEGPAAIHDPGTAELICALCEALQEVVKVKSEKARQAHDAELTADQDKIIESLRSTLGKHANSSQQAISALIKFSGQ